MKWRVAPVVGFALSAACAGSAPPSAVPAELLPLYATAATYRNGAWDFLCADAGLRPRFDAAEARLDAARRRLRSWFGEAELEQANLHMISDPRTRCGDRSGAARVISEFEVAVSKLESALP